MINLMILDCVLDEITEHASGHMLSPKYAEPCWRPATAEDGNLEAARTGFSVHPMSTKATKAIIDAWLGVSDGST